MNEKKIAFICHADEELMYEECVYYINKLKIPEGYSIELYRLTEIDSIPEAYNEVQNICDAKYKLYFNQEVHFCYQDILFDIIDIFSDREIGMIGIMGCDSYHNSNEYDSMWNVGGYISYGGNKCIESKCDDKNEYVKVVSKHLIITQYDFLWSVGECEDDYNITHSIDFSEKGYSIVVPQNCNKWVLCEMGSVSPKDEEYHNDKSTVWGQLINGEDEAVDKGIEDFYMKYPTDRTAFSLKALRAISTSERNYYGGSNIMESKDFLQEMNRLWNVIFLCRRIENGLFFSEYKELVDAVCEGNISLEFLQVVVSRFCISPDETWKKISNALASTKYDKLLAEVKPHPSMNLTWYQCNDVYTDGEIEDKIIQDVLKADDGYYSDIIGERNDWPTYYHLTHVRENILSWYPFSGNENVLEIGCGMGAITGVLCEKCAHVTAVDISKQRATAALLRNRNRDNLEIIVANLNDIEFECKYDVITLIGVFEYQGRYTADGNPYVAFLEKVKKLLSPGGKLFIAIENKCGLKYWCGAREDHIGMPFVGLNQYRYNDGGVRTFSKKELDEMLLTVGFGYRYFYYPMPDYKLPTHIFSQDYLPNVQDVDSIGLYYAPDQKTIVAKEKALYKDVIENNAFEFMANSFLVECSVEAPVSSERYIYSALAFERQPQYRIGTSFGNDGNVYKYALKSEGAMHIANVFKAAKKFNVGELKLLEINEDGNRVVTPIVNYPTAEQLLLEAYKNSDTLQIFKIFDNIYRDICKSSEIVTEECCLLGIEKSGLPGGDYGPILKYGFLDLISQNVFVQDDDSYLWFDQEWVMPNVPIALIMMRGIVNFYNKHELAMTILPVSVLFERYDLGDKWQDLMAYDRLFVSRVSDFKYLETKGLFEYVPEKIIVDNMLKFV